MISLEPTSFRFRKFVCNLRRTGDVRRRVEEFRRTVINVRSLIGALVARGQGCGLVHAVLHLIQRSLEHPGMLLKIVECCNQKEYKLLRHGLV
jgi:hypothetical protein